MSSAYRRHAYRRHNAPSAPSSTGSYEYRRSSIKRQHNEIVDTRAQKPLDKSLGAAEQSTAPANSNDDDDDDDDDDNYRDDQAQLKELVFRVYVCHSSAQRVETNAAFLDELLCRAADKIRCRRRVEFRDRRSSADEQNFINAYRTVLDSVVYSSRYRVRVEITSSAYMDPNDRSSHEKAMRDADLCVFDATVASTPEHVPIMAPDNIEQSRQALATGRLAVARSVENFRRAADVSVDVDDRSLQSGDGRVALEEDDECTAADTNDDEDYAAVLAIFSSRENRSPGDKRSPAIGSLSAENSPTFSARRETSLRHFDYRGARLPGIAAGGGGDVPVVDQYDQKAGVRRSFDSLLLHRLGMASTLADDRSRILLVLNMGYSLPEHIPREVRERYPLFSYNLKLPYDHRHYVLGENPVRQSVKRLEDDLDRLKSKMADMLSVDLSYQLKRAIHDKIYTELLDDFALCLRKHYARWAHSPSPASSVLVLGGLSLEQRTAIVDRYTYIYETFGVHAARELHDSHDVLVALRTRSRQQLIDSLRDRLYHCALSNGFAVSLLANAGASSSSPQSHECETSVVGQRSREATKHDECSRRKRRRQEIEYCNDIDSIAVYTSEEEEEEEEESIEETRRAPDNRETLSSSSEQKTQVHVDVESFIDSFHGSSSSSLLALEVCDRRLIERLRPDAWHIKECMQRREHD